MARAWAEIDLAAVRHNVAALREHVAPARVCGVVKANGYGHGAVAVGRAALEAGADWLAVAQVDEAAALRAAGVEAPLIVLSEPCADEADAAVATGARLTVYTPGAVHALAAAARRRGGGPVPVHLKVDTGMRRVGVEPPDAVGTAKAIAATDELVLEGVFTHFPVADEPGNPFTARQIDRFEAVLRDLQAAGFTPDIVHAANSAAALVHPAARYDMVRTGIALYGISPAPGLAGTVELRQALTLASEVAFVKRVPAGEGVSYGLRQITTGDTVVATVPIGYADGVFRALPVAGQEVLVQGRRCPMIGVVTMDQLMIDLGPDADVAVGEPVVLLGAQGDEMITPDEWAARLDTISYEVVCAIGPRVERRHR